MRHPFRLARPLKTAAAAVSCAVALCLLPQAASALSFGDLLLKPTPYAGRHVPTTYGTPHYCRSFKKTHASGWRGIIAGRKYDFDKSYVISRSGCFETRQTCEAYLTGMSPYVDYQTYRRCEAF